MQENKSSQKSDQWNTPDYWNYLSLPIYNLALNAKIR